MRKMVEIAKPQVVVNLAALPTVAETVRYESLIEKDDPLVAIVALELIQMRRRGMMAALKSRIGLYL